MNVYNNREMLKDEILWEVHFLHKHFNINVFYWRMWIYE